MTVFKKREVTTISVAGAQAVLDACTASASAEGAAYSLAVVDGAGNLVAFLRMDGAPLISIQIAQDKAYTAAGFGISTADWAAFIAGDEPLKISAPSAFDRLVAVGGGVPLLVDGALVGGLGVSGGHYTSDMAIADAGKTAFESLG